MRTLSRLLAVAALVSGFLFPESALAQDCATNPPVTCTQGNQVDTVFGNPPTTDTCFGCPFGTQDGTWSTTSASYRQLRLPKFTLGAGVCGSLIQAELTITYQTQTVIRVENLDNKQQQVQAQVNLEGRVFPLNVPGLSTFIIPNNTARSYVLPAFDGNIDFMGNSGRTETTPVVTNTRCFRITDPTLLAGFIAGGGSNFLLFDHASIDSSVVSGPGNVASALNTVGLLSATVTYRSCVCQVVAQDDTARVCVGNSRTIPVLANDSTTCGALNTASLAFVGTPPAGFTISGTNIVFNATGIAAGVYVATYQVCNNQNPPCCDTATVTVTVCNTDAVNDTGRVCAGSSVTIPVLANDTTTCGTLNNASLAFVGTPPAGFTITGTSIRYANTGTPNSGTVTATYTICNNESPPCCDNATVTVTICNTDAVNDTARVCAGASVTIPVLTNDTTNCGALNTGSLAFVGTPPAGFTISGTTIVYANSGTPSTGTVTATYRVCNNETPPCCDTATVTVTICNTDAVNDTARVCAGSSVTIPVLANDTTNCGTLNTGSLAFVGTPPAGFTISGSTIVYANTGTPNSGTVTATYRVCNNETPPCCDNATVTVTICNTNAVDDPARVCPGDTVTIPVLANDTTNCGTLNTGSLAFVGTPPPGFSIAGGQVVYANSGTPDSGTVTATYRVCNNETPPCCDTAVVTVTIASPLAVDDRIELLPTTTFPLDIDVLGNDLPGVGCTFPSCTGCAGPPPSTPCAVRIVTGPSFGTATVLRNCKVRYTPGPSFSVGDSFCYEVTDSCGCSATACVTIAACRDVDRNTCGSLLLFPEYDNREQSQTLFTITNGCCDIQDGDLWVEFRFIDALTCQESDFTLRLTPCDTVTFLTSTVNPNSTRGYAYAFAKRLGAGPGNPGGMPIVRNKLIGQALIINGLEDVDYAMNAVSFLGIGPELSDNDDDGDGIRDLNGPLLSIGEYEQAPDEILIPRFLAQDPPGTSAQFQSDLVLVALSGGSAFTTTVEFLVYNDAEDVTSQTSSFYCWDKRPLVQWAPATVRSVLGAQGDDPDEILGAPNQMAGWIRLNGLSATSGQDEILDPAIYAVLIERFESRSVADLPFEKCAQANGDLLPDSPLGDGPVPAVGDGQ